MLEVSKAQLADQIYEKFINKTYCVQGNYSNEAILDLHLTIEMMQYKYRCYKDVDFIEVDQPQIVINEYKNITELTKNITNVTNNGNKLNISVSTSSSVHPLIVGQSTYQSDNLKNQDVVVIFVNNIPEFSIANQFTINKTTGTITRNQTWEQDDTLVIL